MVWYAVHSGRKCGLYESWEEASPQVSGFPGAVFKKFECKEQAELFLRYGPAGKHPTADLRCLRTKNSPEAVYLVSTRYVSCFRKQDSRPNIAWQSDAKDRDGELSALEFALVHIQAEPAEVKVVLRLASSWLYNSLTRWLRGWEHNGWKMYDGKPLAHREKWQAVAKLWRPISCSNRVTLVYEKSHQDAP